MHCWLALPLLLLSAQVAAESGSGGLFADGEVIFDLRYRHEHVGQDNALRDADAHTVRARLGFRTGKWHGVSGLVELDHVGSMGGGRHNDTRNGRTEYAVVADPVGTAVNQAMVRYEGTRGAGVLGRQRINLDNQRFVGGVAWRQNEQTYDGALLQFEPAPGLVLTYAWLDRVNTVFGPDDGPYATAANRARIEGDSHLFNLRFAASPRLVLTAYRYRLDLDNAAVTATAPLGTLSSTTTGVRLNGDIGGFGYVLEYARQMDRGGNPWELDGRYVLAELGYKLRGVQFKAGYEVLGGGDGPGNHAFQTPLATKHLFQGWADMFLTTPPDGIEDLYFGVSAPVGGGTLQAWYHDFSAERGRAGFGREVDLSWSRAIPGLEGLTGLAKYARYDSDDPGRTVDTEKFWLQLQYAY